MKKIFLVFAVISFVLLSFNTIKKTKYNVNTENSIINWKGFKPTGSHYGTLKLSNGHLSIKGGIVIGGEFTIEMNSIVNLDMPAGDENNAKLIGHLKSDDFFGVKNYPTAKFVITEVETDGNKNLVKGNLTIKDKTNPIEFLVNIKIENGKINFKSETFKIDRSKWDIKYKSKSFFDSLGDKFIYDDMEISIELEGVK